MYVKLDYRRRGINAQIIEALKQWAGAQGVTELGVLVPKGRFYTLSS